MSHRTAVWKGWRSIFYWWRSRLVDHLTNGSVQLRGLNLPLCLRRVRRAIANGTEVFGATWRYDRPLGTLIGGALMGVVAAFPRSKCVYILGFGGKV